MPEFATYEQFNKWIELKEAKAWSGQDTTTGKQFHYLEGYASDMSLDRDGDRMSMNALKSMLKNIGDGMNLFLDHEHNLSNTIGIIMKGEIRGDRLWVQARLEDPVVNPNVRSLLNKMETGVKVGLSIGGDMLKHHFEEDHGLNKRVRVIDDVALYEISAVGLPSNEGDFVYGSVFKRKRITEAVYKHQLRNDIVESIEKLLGAEAGQPQQAGQLQQGGMLTHSHVHSHPPGQGHTEPLNHPHMHPIGTPHPSPIDHIGAVDVNPQESGGNEEVGVPAVGMGGQPAMQNTLTEANEGAGQPSVGSGLTSTSYRAAPTTAPTALPTSGEGSGTPVQGSGLPAQSYEAKQDIPFAGRPGGAMGVKNMNKQDLQTIVKIAKKYPGTILIKQGYDGAIGSTPDSQYDWSYADSIDNWGDSSADQPSEASDKDMNRYGTSTADQENSDYPLDPNDVQSPEWIDLSFRTRKSKSSPKGQNRGQISPTLKGAATPSGKM